MMPRVDFYIARDPSPQAAVRTACRLAEKAFQAGMRIHIQTQHSMDIDQLDAMLWTFRDRSFIPHEQFRDDLEIDCPVTIGADMGPDSAEMLINLSQRQTEKFEQFQRIAEVIENQPEYVNAGRERYRFYREQGLEPQHHEVI